VGLVDPHATVKVSPVAQVLTSRPYSAGSGPDSRRRRRSARRNAPRSCSGVRRFYCNMSANGPISVSKSSGAKRSLSTMAAAAIEARLLQLNIASATLSLT